MLVRLPSRRAVACPIPPPMYTPSRRAVRWPKQVRTLLALAALFLMFEQAAASTLCHHMWVTLACPVPWVSGVWNGGVEGHVGPPVNHAAPTWLSLTVQVRVRGRGSRAGTSKHPVACDRGSASSSGLTLLGPGWVALRACFASEGYQDPGWVAISIGVGMTV